MTSRPPRSPPPPPPGTTATELREGVPWTVLTGVISPETLHAATGRYRALGGGPLWVFDALASTRYTAASISCALAIAETASQRHGLVTVIVGVPTPSLLSMGVSVLRMRAHLFTQPVDYVAAASEAEMVAKVKAWIAEFKRAGGVL